MITKDPIKFIEEADEMAIINALTDVSLKLPRQLTCLTHIMYSSSWSINSSSSIVIGKSGLLQKIVGGAAVAAALRSLESVIDVCVDSLLCSCLSYKGG